MGLAGNKKRSKLSHDPNNTAWSKSTDGFGHKILSKQGWQPGQYLGAENASHGEHYTAANASHIRVLLREDNLGIGAKVGGKGDAETFGLSTLSGIFGRLNGKSDEELEKKQGMLRDAELRSYQVQKYGFMNFVRGGLLVGDKIEEFDGKIAAKTVGATSADAGEASKGGKKRKAEDAAPVASEAQSSKSKKRKSEGQEASIVDESNQASRMKRKAVEKAGEESAADAEYSGAEGDAQAAAAVVVDTESKEERRKRKEARRAERAARQGAEAGPSDEKARLKQEKRARKEERRKRKQDKAAKKRSKAAKSEVGSDSSESAGATTSALPTPSESELPSGVSTPLSDAPAFRGRNVIRQRYIQQKRMASMDPRALNEILMIKKPT